MSDKVKDALAASRLSELLSKKDEDDLLKKILIICSVIIVLAATVFVIIKMVNQISALFVCKRFCFLHTVANKLTGLLLFLTVPALFWSMIPIAIVAAMATFAAVQEGHFIRTKQFF